MIGVSLSDNPQISNQHKTRFRVRFHRFVSDRIERSWTNKEKAKLALAFQEWVQFKGSVVGGAVTFAGDLAYRTANNTDVAFVEIVTVEFRFIEGAGSLTD